MRALFQLRIMDELTVSRVAEKETAHSIDAVVDWSREMKQLRKDRS